MDKKKKVISKKNLPTKVNLYGIITLWLLLDRFHIPSWGWGIYWTLVTLATIGVFINFYNEEEVDVLKETKGEN
jgi:hypothetical protein